MDKIVCCKYIIPITVASIMVLLLGYAIESQKRLEEKWKNAVESNKAYDEILSSSEENARALKLSVDQIKHSKDSVIKELEAARKELKIKDSRLKSLQHISSEFAVADTVVARDTIFKDEQVSIDTLLYDGWYSLRMKLEYPSTVVAEPEFKSVKNIVVSAKKETVDPPKKFFLFRWFQKKHWVLNIDVIEKSPYVKSQKSRYIEVLK